MTRLASLAALLVVTSASGISHAGDSAWVWCKGTAEHGAKSDVSTTYFAASVLEHRGAKAGTREIAVTLVYGDHVGRGVIVEQDPDALGGKLAVRSIDGKRPVTFTGTAGLAMDLSGFTLTGSIDFEFGASAKPAMVPFTAKLTCEPLDDLAIGH